MLLTAATAGNAPVYTQAASSLRNFQRNFGDLKKAGSMNMVERVVFSLVLSSSKTPPPAGESHLPRIGPT